MNITKNRRTWFTISGIAVLASIILSLGMGFNLGLDFTGGARWQVEFTGETTPTQNELQAFFAERSELTQAAKIQPTEEANQYLITIQDLDDEQLQAIRGSLAEDVGAFDEINYRKVDSSIGKSFQRKSVWAIIGALIAIIITVAISFRKVPKSINPLRFGAVAIIALFHDIIIILGIFAVLTTITGLELDLQFITALLATLGFSVNDTIVILDRVRENIGKQKSTETFTDTVEKSVQQTLMRSINTSISTLLPLVGLLIFGADSIFYFVLALVIGIVIGTWSSIFLAAPLLAEWKVLSDKRE